MATYERLGNILGDQKLGSFENFQFGNLFHGMDGWDRLGSHTKEFEGIGAWQDEFKGVSGLDGLGGLKWVLLLLLAGGIGGGVYYWKKVRPKALAARRRKARRNRK